MNKAEKLIKRAYDEALGDHKEKVLDVYTAIYKKIGKNSNMPPEYKEALKPYLK